VIDGEEQNEFRADWLFRMFEKAHPTHTLVRERRAYLQYRGRHHAYARLADPVVHERTFTLSRTDGTLTIDDVLSGRGAHRLQWQFHTAPGAQVDIQRDGSVDVRAGAAHVTLAAPDGVRPVVEARWYSPSYGVRRPSAAIAFETEGRLAKRNAYTFRISLG